MAAVAADGRDVRRRGGGKKKPPKKTTNSGTFSCGGLGGAETNSPESKAAMFARSAPPPLAFDVLLR